MGYQGNSNISGCVQNFKMQDLIQSYFQLFPVIVLSQ